MRNLKRALSLALATFMLLGMMVVGAGAVSISDFSDGESIANDEAVLTLVELGVIKGNPDGTYDPTGIVTRAQMAKMICVVLNGGKDPVLGSSATSSYTDVAASNWASPYIEYCTNLGILAGYGNGIFMPDATVSGSEAAKMLLTAIGYQSSIEGFTGPNWAVSTNVRASQIGLFEGLEINPTEGLTRDSAAQMVYNALDAYVVTYKYTLVSDGQGGFKSVTELQETNAAGVNHITVLEDKFKAVRVEAVVLSNEIADVNTLNYKSSDDVGETTIAVLPNSPGVDGTYKVTTDKNLLGESVYMYIKYKDERSIVKDAVVIGKPIATEKNKVVNSTDGTGLASLLDDNKLDVNADTWYLVNYGGTYANGDSTKTPSTMTKAAFETACGTVGVGVKLIDFDNDKIVDFALAEQYSFGSVTKYNEDDKGTFYVQNAFSKDDYKSDDVVGFDDVARDDLVLFCEYGSRIYVQKPETIEGKLENYSTSKKNVIIDGTTIAWSGLNGSVDAAYDLEKVGEYVISTGVLNTSATYYMDNNGYVFAVGQADDSQFSYAVLLGFENQTGASNTSIGREAKARLLYSDGTIATTVVATIEGKKVTNCTNNDSGHFLPAAGTDQVGFRDNNVGNIYAYTKNDAGQVRLNEKTSENATTTAGLKYEKTKATLYVDRSTQPGAPDSSYTVTDRTVFLYYNAANGKVSQFTGKSAPSVLDVENGSNYKTGTLMSVKANGRGEALVVYVNAAPLNDFKDNYMYVYKAKVSESGKGYEVNGIMDGKIDVYSISSAKKSDNTEAIKEDWYTDENGKSDFGHIITPGLYQYSKEDDGTFALQQVADAHQYMVGNGTTRDVQAVGANYIRVGDRSYIRNADTKVLYARTDKNAYENATLSKGDRIVLVVNDDDVVLYAFITMWNSDYTGPSSGPDFNWEVPNATTLTELHDVADVHAEFKAGKNVIINGNWATDAPLTIPNGYILMIKGDMTSNAVNNVKSSGALKVQGTLTMKQNTLTGSIQAVNLTMSSGSGSPITFNADVTVEEAIRSNNQGVTVSSGKTVHAKNINLGTGNLVNNGHIEWTDTLTANNADDFSANSMKGSKMVLSGILTIGKVGAPGNFNVPDVTANRIDTVNAVAVNITSAIKPNSGSTITLNGNPGNPPVVNLTGKITGNIVATDLKLTTGEVTGTVTATDCALVTGNVGGAVIATNGSLTTGTIGGALTANSTKLDVGVVTGNVTLTGTANGTITSAPAIDNKGTGTVTTAPADDKTVTTLIGNVSGNYGGKVTLGATAIAVKKTALTVNDVIITAGAKVDGTLTINGEVTGLDNLAVSGNTTTDAAMTVTFGEKATVAEGTTSAKFVDNGGTTLGAVHGDKNTTAVATMSFKWTNIGTTEDASYAFKSTTNFPLKSATVPDEGEGDVSIDTQLKIDAAAAKTLEFYPDGGGATLKYGFDPVSGDYVEIPAGVTTILIKSDSAWVGMAHVLYNGKVYAVNSAAGTIPVPVTDLVKDTAMKTTDFVVVSKVTVATGVTLKADPSTTGSVCLPKDGKYYAAGKVIATKTDAVGFIAVDNADAVTDVAANGKTATLGISTAFTIDGDTWVHDAAQILAQTGAGNAKFGTATGENDITDAAAGTSNGATWVAVGTPVFVETENASSIIKTGVGAPTDFVAVTKPTSDAMSVYTFAMPAANVAATAFSDKAALKLTVPAHVTVTAKASSTKYEGAKPNESFFVTGDTAVLTGLEGTYYATKAAPAAAGDFTAIPASGEFAISAITAVYDGYYKVTGEADVAEGAAKVLGTSTKTVGKYFYTTAAGDGVVKDSDNFFVKADSVLTFTVTWKETTITDAKDTVTITATNSSLDPDNGEVFEFAGSTPNPAAQSVTITDFSDNSTIAVTGTHIT